MQRVIFFNIPRLAYLYSNVTSQKVAATATNGQLIALAGSKQTNRITCSTATVTTSGGEVR